MKKKYPYYGMAKIVPPGLIKKFAIKRLFKDSNSPQYWYKHNDIARLTAFYGSKEAYENAENWNKFGNIVEYDPEEPINLEYLTNVDYRLVEVDGIGYNLYTDGTAEVANALRVLYEEGGGWNEKRSEVFLDEDWKDWESFNWDGSEFGWEEFSVTDTIFIYSGNIVIPDSLNFKGHTYTVTTINSNAFRGSKDMTSITIPSTITSIGKNAFNTCI